MNDLLWAEDMPTAYDRWLGPVLFEPYAADLARRVAARAPQRVLEIAAGTGVVTRHLLSSLAEGTEVTATDLSEAMVATGSARAPGAHWQPADALDLPFEDTAFDVVACQFGVMFFPDKPRGFAEAARVLAPGGALLCSTWDAVERNDLATALVAGLERAIPDEPPTFVLAIPHGYADVDRIRADAAAGGLGVADVETVELETVASSVEDVARGFCYGTPLRLAISGRADLALDDVVATVAAEMVERLGSAGPVTTRLTAHVVTAERPRG